MAKAQRFFNGNDSYGRNVEVAQSVEGVWFYRAYEFNGYAKAWSRWEVLNEDNIRWETHGRNVYSDEVFQWDKPRLSWGFNLLTEWANLPRVRLPNIEKKELIS